MYHDVSKDITKILICQVRHPYIIKNCPTGLAERQFLFGSGAWIRTKDLWVMSPTSYQAAPPRNVGVIIAKVRSAGKDYYFFFDGNSFITTSPFRTIPTFSLARFSM